MEYRDEINKMKRSTVLEKVADYSFPKYLRALRRCVGSRKLVSEETQIPYHRLEYLESGRNNKVPEEDELVILEQYLGVQPDILRKKAEEFLYKKAC